MVIIFGLVALANQAKALSLPQIAITEAYVNAGHQNNGIFTPTVFQGQQLQFREDFSHPSKIIHVYCAIDGHYVYRSSCSTPFEGKAYIWIFTAGISTNNLNDGPHTYNVLIDTEDGRNNMASLRFDQTHKVHIDTPVVNGRCQQIYFNHEQIDKVFRYNKSKI
jgi:hypothetical protein